ncbi:RidA family protein [Ferrovibrio sp.]|uniref:RidA family protein n=1 Tax=Ferrovibrio sp. TaxID=1917215 RepID=UPI002601FE87|nr:RidA family protein [Ferrovibrio sp.]
MGTDIRRIQTNARMSKAVICGGMVFLSGQTSSGMAADSLDQQMQEVLGRIDKLLAEAGSDKSHLLTATIYLKSVADFAAMNVIWEGWIPSGAAPARTTVEARLASPDLLVEITVAARLP